MNRTLFILGMILLAAGSLAWFAPGIAIQPGQLLEAHASLANDCTACHTIGQGVQADKCMACHGPAEIGLLTVAGSPLSNPRSALQGLHQRNAERACTECHMEHAGRLGSGAATGFSHARLPEDLVNDCLACHQDQLPGDPLHASVVVSCGECHSQDAWSPARFEHDLLRTASVSCLDCHRPDLPEDQLHAGLSPDPDCRACHQTRSWSPADFDHERWFRFDRHHPARCLDCHKQAGSYEEYTCTGCHAHSPAKIAREHREEGIRDFQNCVECHRSGNEHEIIGRGGSREGGSRENGEHRSRREHDDEDDD
ncbi:MAG: hypothetical protein KC518_06195 [Candidatus Cloacimonetes bacterium]|nr:hypothetical protein [Candidatus Cloacimonadota bacterium]